MVDYTKKEITIVFLSTYIGYWDLGLNTGTENESETEKRCFSQVGF